MTFGEVITTDQAEHRIGVEGFFSIGEPNPIDTDLVLAAIERDIMARRSNVQDLGLFEKWRDQELAVGNQERAALHTQNAKDMERKIGIIEAELKTYCEKYLERFAKPALKAST
jgi:hypothetical protein